MPKVKSIQEFIGTKFGYWTLLYDYGRIDKKRLVAVRCICGYERKIDFAEIKRGKSTNCGCQCRSDVNDFIGKKVNKLTIIEILEVVKNKTRVKCICDCGKYTVCRFDSIVGGLTKSCGCLNIESSTIHGLCKHRLFKVWNGMIQRCYNKKSKAYKNYGERGVAVCDGWKNDFKTFYYWAIERWEPGLQLDKDLLAFGKTGYLYSPEFCCFLTPKENCNNKSNNILIEYKGETKNINEWSKDLNLSRSLLYNRIYKLKWPIEKAFNEPLIRKYSKLYR